MIQDVDSLVADLLGKELTLARDYASIINWSITKIQEWTDSWTDFTITDPGILFVNADGYMYDMINFVLDEAYMNNILRYTKSKESLYFMSLLVGLELPSYVASEARVKIENPFKISIQIPEDYPIYVRDKSTGEEVWFYAKEATYIPSEAYNYVNMLEGKRTAVNTTFGNFDEHFQFILPVINVASNAVFVWVRPSEADPWQKLEKISDAFLSVKNGLCYSVHAGYNNTYIKLPPGSGHVLTENSEVKIIYGVTAGSGANLGEVKALPGATILQGGIAIEGKMKFTVLYADGGSDPLNLEDTRVYIGNNSWRVDSLIITDDFNQMAAKYFPNIIRFVPVQNQGEEEMRLFYLPVEGLSEEDKEALVEDIYERAQPLMFGGTILSVSEMNYKKITFQFEITLGTNSSDTSSIQQQVESLLADYFDRTTQEQEMTVHRSAIISLIETNIYEADYVVCVSPSSDMSAEKTEIFELTGVSITFVQKGR